MMRLSPAGVVVKSRVSILVVLDWTMMPSEESQYPHDPPVSILVVLDWTMMRSVGSMIAVDRTVFQSLLYWIGQ